MALQARVKITKCADLGEGIFELVFSCPQMAGEARPGQFVNVYSDDGARLLPRPISICEILDAGQIRLVYRVVGAGTKEMSGKKPGGELTVLGPLGNGYPFEGKKAVLLGGGVGIPPLLELEKEIGIPAAAFLGYRSDKTFLLDDFREKGPVYVSSDDGSIGIKGNVITALEKAVQDGFSLDGAVLYACGPRPMLKGVKNFAQQHGLKAYISLEERMACGIGACLGCVCKTTGVDGHSGVKNARVCKDGPVFDAGEVDLS